MIKLPLEVQHLTVPSYWPKTPLAYVEWFSILPSSPREHHNMYHIYKTAGPDKAYPAGDIVHISSIRQSCMLFPNFGTAVPSDWTRDNVLDNSTSFLINNWSSLYAFKTIW